jgi:hypothetical protein
MRTALLLFLVAACNGSSGTDGGSSVDGATDGNTGVDAPSDTGVPDDSGGMQDTGTGPQTCVIPKGGAMCGGVNWACDETADCAPGNACCLTLDMMVVKGSGCTGFCQNPRLQLCQTNTECSGGMNCMATTCSGFVVKTCGGVPANLCK